VNTGAILHTRVHRAVFMAREHGPWTRVVCTEVKGSKHYVHSLGSDLQGRIQDTGSVELRFYVPLNTKQVISETFFLANFLA